MNGEIHVWMPMIGFDREEADKGVGKLLERTSFTPNGVSAFLFHPDIVHQHAGMSVERVLPPDNCSYYGSARNEERARQEWTSYDLRTLVANLNAAGVEPYLGIMGVDLGDRWHREWISEHPEVKLASRTYEWSLNVLKRLADGTYYEDFFVDKLCETLTDYGFAGLQVADNFCPSAATIHDGDFSADMLDQFVAHSGVSLPPELRDGLRDDSRAMRARRGDWIWRSCRQEWVEFHAWRWEQFWRKVCGRLHELGKKTIVLGMYCTDPFETLYCKGIDLRRLVRAGVVYLMPNIVPTGLRLQHSDYPDRFHRYMALAPLTAAFVPDGKLVSLLGVKDATEEWDVLHHAPCLLERDIYTLLSFMADTGAGMKRCLDGLMVCLGDGIRAEEWQWLRERFEVGFVEDVKRVLAPTLVWSDAAFRNTLPAYIRTRRWTLHKFTYEMAERGARCGAVMRIENLASAQGGLFVPNFDLLSEAEKRAVAGYRKGPVVCTAADEGFHPEEYGIRPDIYFVDKFSTYPLCAFAFNASIENKDAIMALAETDDGTGNLQGDPVDAEEHSNVLAETLTFAKVTAGFGDACALLLRTVGTELFTCNLPMVPMQMTDGRYRLYLSNPEVNSYGYANVTAKHPIEQVVSVSKYPVLPVKFMDSPDEAVGWMGKDSTGEERTFRVKVPPGGVTILDVLLRSINAGDADVAACPPS
jgi:hypothetical protein